MISDETVAQVRAYPDIVAILSDYVPLKKRGRNYIGLCPFHSERTPSFTVSPDKQLWHCFGCHASGDHIGFVMKIDNVSFSEAVVHIANRAGIPVVEVERSASLSAFDQRRKSILDILYAVRGYFESKFLGSPGADYLVKRGFDPQVLARFHVGFCPGAATFLADAKAAGWNFELLREAGVLSQSETGEWRVRFWNRVMFPIMDHQGRTVGFGGRTLDPEGMPKYINTDETMVFNKRKLFYGLDAAKSSIQKKGQALLMEGYLDVIAAHQFGFDTAIATMGTALTSDHAQMLRRLTQNVVMIFDADTAGQAAVERSYEVLRTYEFQMSVVVLAEKDPSDTLMKDGEAVFAKAITEAQPILAYRLAAAHRQWRGKIEEVPALLEGILGMLHSEPDPMILRFYVKQIASLFKLEPEWVLAKVKQVRYTSAKQSFPKQDSQDKYHKAQDFIVFCMAGDLTLRHQILEQITPSEFMSDPYRSLVTWISASDAVDQALVVTIQEPSLSQLLSRILLKGGDVGSDLKDCISVFKSYQKHQSVESLKQQMAQAESQGNDEEVTRILQTIRDLLPNQ